MVFRVQFWSEDAPRGAGRRQGIWFSAFLLLIPVPFSEAEPPAVGRPARKEPLVVREHEDIILLATLAAPSAATVTWLKDGVEIRRSKRHEMTSQGDAHTLTVRNAQTLDSAVYSCRVGSAGHDFLVQVQGEQVGTEGMLCSGCWSLLEFMTGFPLTSTEVPAKFLKPLEPVNGDLGGTVTLVCELSPEQAEVVWHCGNTQLRTGKRFHMVAEGPRRLLTVSGLRAEDAGEYKCVSRDEQTSAWLTVSGK